MRRDKCSNASGRAARECDATSAVTRAAAPLCECDAYNGWRVLQVINLQNSPSPVESYAQSATRASMYAISRVVSLRFSIFNKGRRVLYDDDEAVPCGTAVRVRGCN